MEDHKVPLGHDQAGLVLQGRRGRLHQLEQPLPARRDVGAMLDVVGRPVAQGRDIVSLVEEGIEGLKDECLIPLLFRLTHKAPSPSPCACHAREFVSEVPHLNSPPG